MTTPMPPMCLWCTRFRSGFSCEAFPNGIPDDILFDHVDHRFDHRGDHGLRFIPNGVEPVSWILDTYDSIAYDRMSQVDAVLADFCRDANLNPTPLLVKHKRSPLMGTWSSCSITSDPIRADQIWTEAEIIEAESTNEYCRIVRVPPVAQILLGDPGEVILTLDTEGTIEVSEFAVRWFGPGDPVAYRIADGEVCVRPDLPLVDRSERVAEAISALRRRRRRRFRRCSRCLEMIPPEWWWGKELCQSCAEKRLGVVF